MNEIFQPVTSTDDAKAVIIGAKRRLRGAHSELSEQADGYAKLIESIWYLADNTADGQATARMMAIKFRAELDRALALLTELSAIGGQLGSYVIAGEQALDESDARRKAVRSRLGI